MTVHIGPPVCQEEIKIDELSYGKCHRELPCKAEHATEEEIRRIHVRWGWTQALSHISWRIENGADTDSILAFIDRDLRGK
jgi:hypothetical protein